MSPDDPPPFDPTAGDRRQHRRKGWRYLAGAAVVGLIMAGLWPAPLPVETATVDRGAVIATVNEEGVTQVRNRYVVSSPAAGQLRRIALKPGAEIIAGETVLAVLEPAGGDILDQRSRAQAEAQVRAAQSQLLRAEAQQAQAEAALELAEAEANRQRSLAERQLISTQQLDTVLNRERTVAQEARAAEFARQVAQHELEQAQAGLARGTGAGAPVDSLITLTSPVSGQVLRVMQESSRVISSGMPIMEIGDPADLEVRIEVLSRDGVAIQPGARVRLEHWGGEVPLEARVRRVEPAAFTKISALGVEEQRVNVIADLITPADDRRNLGDGYRVEAQIERARRDDVLRAPLGALFQGGEDWFTFVMQQGKLEKRSVSIGLNNGLLAEVIAGLREGEQVVLYPGDRITDGSRVEQIND